MSSTDLQFRQDLLQIRLPAVKTTAISRQSAAAAAAIDDDHLQNSQKEDSTTTTVAVGEKEDECSTPTSAEHRIPTVFDCPPAPKKNRYEPLPVSCKRKLAYEFQFYEIVAREEIEEFFRSGFEAVNRNSKRRR